MFSSASEEASDQIEETIAFNGLEVRLTDDDKGLGAFATKSWVPGETIISEPPLVSWCQDIGKSRDENLQELHAAVAALSKDDSVAFYAMSQDAVVHGSVKNALGVWMTNAHAAGPVGSLVTAIFRIARS